ncbi:hypothetical protein B0H10DRAFT_588698 [Mycena sp. CBHHK59/15]|nr:hypothetical protein B0H10DRAFT_588698 [Mycena sp. CBHHK59/15]
MSSDLESLVDRWQSQDSAPLAESPRPPRHRRPLRRSHPRLTGYRILFFISTGGFGTIKAVLSYNGHTTVPTTLDWVYGVVVVYMLYWLGLYEEECSGKLPAWMFETDLVESVNEKIARCSAQYQDANLLGSLRILLRMVMGFPCQHPEDPEQHFHLRDLPADPTLDLSTEATGIELRALSGSTVTYLSNSGGQFHRRRNQEKKQVNQVECDYCNQTFTSAGALHQHCMKRKDHPYCESCQKNFGDEQALEQHIRDASVHQFCEPCDRQFSHRKAFCQHLAASSHHDWCFVCWKDFDGYAQLKKHCASSHLGKGKRAECPLCSDDFPNPVVIGPHIEMGCQ